MTDALLREVLAEVRALREDVAALASRGRLSREERATLAELLPALAATVGNAEFLVGDLFEVPRLRPLLAGYTVRTLPVLLARANGAPHGGYRVLRAARSRDGNLWRLRVETAARAGVRVA